MTPQPAIILANLLKNNHAMLRSLVDGISQEESVMQLPFEGNCLNWVIGHILDTYCACQGWLGMPAPDAEVYEKKYGYGSEPVTCPENALDLEEMLKRLDAGLLMITTQLECIPAVELESPIQLWMGTVTNLEALYYMMWHISYHTGQLEQLRQLKKA